MNNAISFFRFYSSYPQPFPLHNLDLSSIQRGKGKFFLLVQLFGNSLCHMELDEMVASCGRFKERAEGMDFVVGFALPFYRQDNKAEKLDALRGEGLWAILIIIDAPLILGAKWSKNAQK